MLALGSFVRWKRMLRDNELKCARGAGKGGVRKHSAPNRRENSTFPGTLAIPATLLPWTGGVLLQAVDKVNGVARAGVAATACGLPAARGTVQVVQPRLPGGPFHEHGPAAWWHCSVSQAGRQV